MSDKKVAKIKSSKKTEKPSKKSTKKTETIKKSSNNPVILITGTPGTGKSTILKESKLPTLIVSDLIKNEGLHRGYDESLDTFIVSDKKTRRRLLQLIPEMAAKGPVLVESHSCGIFDTDEMEELITHVLVLRCRTDVIFDRLSARGYTPRKRDENVECEIMGICEEEAREVFQNVPIKSLDCNTEEDKQAILSAISKILE